MNKKKLSLIMMMLSLAGCGGDGGLGTALGTSGAGPMLLADTTVGNGSTGSDAAAQSSQFLTEAYRDGLGEIQLSQLALQKSTSGAVQRFAQRMVNDHTQMNNAITQLAQSRNIALPTDLSADQKALLDRLSALSGSEFDRAYAAANVDDHHTALNLTRQQATQGTDANVKLLASQVLPLLEVHLAVAEELNALLDPGAFLVAEYQGGLEEIRLAQIALQNASNADVRQFAQRMIDDHNSANDRISALAAQKGVSLPSSLPPDTQAAIDETAAFSGADFDKAYMDKNVVTHAKAVLLAVLQSTRGKDSDIRSMALGLLPALRSHLQTARDIDSQLTPSFLYSAYQNGTAEIQLAQLALMRGTDPQVKAYAQRMITDHAAANTQISQLAQQRSQALPTEMSADQWGEYVLLLGRSGAGFDRAYMDLNVREHTRAVTEASTQAQSTGDSSLATLARNLLPTLNAHLTEATQLQQQLGGAATPSTMPSTMSGTTAP